MPEQITKTTAAEAAEIAARSAVAFALWSRLSPQERAPFLVVIADALDANRDELVSIAAEETGLSEARLTGELNRTAVQLRLFATTIADGSYLDIRLDEADPEFVLGQRPDLRRILVPRGPVVNFSASNFPFAFSVVGGDTAAALAAGCTVVVKAHSGHPRLSVRTRAVASEALQGAGAPADVLQLVIGQEAGVALIRDEHIKVGSFTGSLYAGRLLADEAAARRDPIPFYGELGSVNPVFITPAAIAERAPGIAAEYVASVSGSAGQLCTKPGIVFAPSAAALEGYISAHAGAVGEHRLLNKNISDGFDKRREEVLAADGVRVLAEGSLRRDEAGNAWVTPTIVAVGIDAFRRAGDALREEAFGPLSVIVESGDDADYAALLDEFFEGNITTTLQFGAADSGADLDELVRRAALTSGRVIFNQWPTGVAVTPAMQHGGPWPATTIDSTSVGTAAIQRFLRGVAYQNAPQDMLPAELRDQNPEALPQHEDPAGSSWSWGKV